MNKGLLSIAALLVAVVLFFAVNIVGGTSMRGARADLTEGRLYTLSEGAKSTARKLKEPIDLTLYYSEKAANDVPQIKGYATRVRELLTELSQSSGGKVRVRIVDPEPFSDDEDQAVQAGLVGQPLGRGMDRLYFGLVGVNSTDKREVIPFFAPDREGFLEYDVTRIVHLLAEDAKKTVGVMTWLPLEGMPMNPMGGRGVPPWQILEQMKELFEVKTVENSAREIPDDIGVLMVVHPKGISTQTQYAVDQFVMRGGRLLVFVDPLCEQDLPPGMNPMQAMQLPKASELNTLLSAWGAEMVPGRVAADRDNALTVGVGPQTRQEALPYIAYLRLNDKAFSATDPVTGDLKGAILATAGVLKKRDGATTAFEPLLHTSRNSMELDAGAISFMPDVKGLLANFKSEDAELTLAARITGPAKSAFPDGAPAPPPPPAGQEPDALAIEAAKAAHIAEARTPINVVVVADCDMLADNFWIRAQRIGDLVLGYSKVSDNGDFVIGALDNLGGSSDLMTLRARGGFNRPFDRVDQIRRDAEDKYLQEEQKLQAKLKQTEQKIGELQQQKPDGQTIAVLSPEQEKEIASFRAEMVETRKQLRGVQHALNRDIERLGTRLKIFNLAIMPGVVAAVAIGLSTYRLGRRKSDRLKAGRG